LIIDSAKANELIACSCFVSKIQKIDAQQDNFKFQQSLPLLYNIGLYVLLQRLVRKWTHERKPAASLQLHECEENLPYFDYYVAGKLINGYSRCCHIADGDGSE